MYISGKSLPLPSWHSYSSQLVKGVPISPPIPPWFDGRSKWVNVCQRSKWVNIFAHAKRSELEPKLRKPWEF